MERSTTPGLGDTYYYYDALGHLVRQGLDVDGGAGLQDASNDRITEFESRYVQDGNGHFWLQSQTITLPEAGSAARLIVSRQEERLTGFAPDVSAESVTWANELVPSPEYAALPSNRAAKTVMKTFRLDKKVEITRTVPGVSNAETTYTLNGLTVRKVSAAGAKVDYFFDSLGRPYRELEDLANGVPADGPTQVERQVEYVSGKTQRYRVRGPDSAGALAVYSEYEYYADGRVKSVKDALGKYTRYEYTPRGETAYVWGDTVNPAKHEYSTYGQLDKLTTYRSGTDWTSITRPTSFQNPGDVATWVFDEATGLLKEKRDALHTQPAPRAVTYAYDSYNRLQTRTWARGVQTTYGYDPKTGGLLAVDYSDTMPLVTGVGSFGSLRNNHTGWVGFRFQVGSVPLTVTELGRWVVSGNSGSHMVQLFNSDGTAVAGGSVTVNTAGKPAGQVAYAALSAPITLAANTTYAVMSQEVNGGDQWYDYWNTQITLTSVASSAAAVWAYNTFPPYYGASSGENQSYGPVNLRYVSGNSTPDVTRTYKRSGQLNSVTDAAGTRSFSYRTGIDYALDYETLDAAFYDTSHILKYKYNATDRRPEGYIYGVSTSGGASYTTKHLDVGTSLDGASGRLTTLQSLTRNDTRSHTFTYSYLGGTHIVSSLSGPHGTLQKRVYEPYRKMLQSYQNKQGASSDAVYDFTRDILGRIDTEHQTGLIFNGYGNYNEITVDHDYNDRGEVLKITSKVNNNTYSLPDRYHEFSYDDAGNRKEDWRNVKDDAHKDAYTVNALNQYTGKSNRAYQSARGYGSPASYYYFQLAFPYSGTYYPQQQGGGSYFYSEITRPDSSTTAHTAQVDLRDVYGGFQGSQYLTYARASETLQYDLDGNLTSDDLYNYSYDAENRLIKVASKLNTSSKEFLYDYLNRRVQERQLSGSTETGLRRFVYVGNSLIARMTVSGTTKTVASTYTWGLDISDSFGAGGGIGGLLLVDNSSTAQYVPGYDGKGNLTILIDAINNVSPSANIKLQIEYGPYGEILYYKGTLSLTPFRYQTKWSLDFENSTTTLIGLYDFGRRFYSVRFGRWLNRDPLGEGGGANLYRYLGNQPPNLIDPLGFRPGLFMPKDMRWVRDTLWSIQTGWQIAYISPDSLDRFGGMVSQARAFDFQDRVWSSAPGGASDLPESGSSGFFGNFSPVGSSGILDPNPSEHPMLTLDPNAGAAAIIAQMFPWVSDSSLGSPPIADVIGGLGFSFGPLGDPIQFSDAGDRLFIIPDFQDDSRFLDLIPLVYNGRMFRESVSTGDWLSATGYGLGFAGEAILTVITIGQSAEVLAMLRGTTLVEARLQMHLNNALARYELEGLTEAQTARLVAEPAREAAFRGERIHTFFFESAASDSFLESRGLQFTPRFTFGPDVYNPITRVWYDVTTPAQWNRHVLKYEELFGEGTPLYYNFGN